MILKKNKQQKKHPYPLKFFFQFFVLYLDIFKLDIIIIFIFFVAILQFFALKE